MKRLGPLGEVELHQDGSGVGSAWRVDSVTVLDVSPEGDETLFVFPVNCYVDGGKRRSFEVQEHADELASADGADDAHGSAAMGLTSAAGGMFKSRRRRKLPTGAGMGGLAAGRSTLSLKMARQIRKKAGMGPRLLRKTIRSTERLALKCVDLHEAQEKGERRRVEAAAALAAVDTTVVWKEL